MDNSALEIEYVAVDSLVPYANNAKIHTDAQVEQIANSIKEFGFNDPIGVWTNEKGELEIVEGHGRVLAAKEIGIKVVPVIHLDHLTDEERRAYAHVHNQTTLTSGFDWDILSKELNELDFDFGSFGFDDGMFDDEEKPEPKHAEDNEEYKGNLAKRFGFVPFSVIQADAGSWQERKRAWIGLGIKSEDGRAGGLAYEAGLLSLQASYYNK